MNNNITAFFESLHKEQWKEVRLGEIVEIFDYKRIPLSAMQRNIRKGIYPYYGASGIIDCIDDFIFDGEFVLVSEDGENLKSRKTPIAFKANGKFWVNNHAHIIRGKKPHLNNLIIYLFRNLDLNPYITGAVQPKLNQAALLDISFIIPMAESTQQQIAEILSSFDDKIDLLTRQNKTLESLALTLFRHTFIDNPNRDEWEEKALSEVCEIKNGFAFKHEEYQNEGIPIIRTTNFENGFIETNNLVYIQNNENKYSKYALRKNDFLLVMVGASIGKYATVTNEILPAFQNQNMWNFRALSNVSQYYLNHAMRYIVNDNINSASGSAREFFQKSYFYKIRILIPEKDIMYKFHKEIDSFYCKIEHNRKEIQSLQSMRDMLLSKILNEKTEV